MIVLRKAPRNSLACCDEWFRLAPSRMIACRPDPSLERARAKALLCSGNSRLWFEVRTDLLVHGEGF